MTERDMKETKFTLNNAGMRLSPNARAKMRATERVMLKYYNDMGKNRGNCTFGIGFFVHKGVCTEEELARKVTATSVEAEYDKRIAEAERRVKQLVKVPLTQDQFDGLVSFTYNTRNDANRPVYEALNRNDFAQAAEMMTASVYVKIDGKAKLAPGLVQRRAEESAPFKIGAKSGNSIGN
jgi:GH24 family phage-related lysozyme (muramidase)